MDDPTPDVVMPRSSTIAGMRTLGIDDRRLGGGLVAFGLVGIVLAGIMALALVLGGLSVRSLGDELEADRLALVGSLEQMATSVGHTADLTGNVRATLVSTEAVIEDTKGTLVELAGAVDSLVGALGFEILGQRPLGPAAEPFAGLSERLKSFAGHLDLVAADLVANQDDLDELSADLADMEERIGALADRVDGFDRTDELVAMATWGLLLAGALAAWIAVAGGLIAWIGWRLRRPAAP